MPRLKVYRTAIGFHDAYVAAPNQKAALRAWGSDKNLFARGAAEVVTEPALTREPMAHPGRVFRRSRGSLDEQLRALGKSPKRNFAKPVRATEPKPAVKAAAPARRPPLAPSRAALDRAETALAEAREAAEQQRQALRKREKALAAERKQLEQAQRKRLERLEDRIERARDAYRAALERWGERSAE